MGRAANGKQGSIGGNERLRGKIDRFKKIKNCLQEGWANEGEKTPNPPTENSMRLSEAARGQKSEFLVLVWAFLQNNRGSVGGEWETERKRKVLGDEGKRRLHGLGYEKAYAEEKRAGQLLQSGKRGRIGQKTRRGGVGNDF